MQMDMMKVGALAVLGVLLGLQFKNQKQEYSIYIGIVIAVMIFSCCIAYMLRVKEQLAGMLSYAGAGSRYFALLLKVTGITWLSEFAAGICRDSGFSTVASQIELFAKIAILFAGMPVFLALTETIVSFVG